MTGRKPSDQEPKTREKRLAEALRANLRRRKAASRVGPDDAESAGKAPNPRDSTEESGPSGRRS